MLLRIVYKVFDDLISLALNSPNLRWALLDWLFDGDREREFFIRYGG